MNSILFLLKSTQSYLKNYSKLIDFIGYSNLFLAFGSFCSTVQGGFLFKDLKSSYYLFAIINFNAAFFLYNLQRIFQSYGFALDTRLLWYRKNRKSLFTIAIIIFLSSSYYYYTAILYYKESIFFYGISGLVSILYFLPPFEIRKVAFLKIFNIALIWVLVCVVIPCLFKDENYTGLKHFTKDHLLYSLSQFFFISAICIPFDIRDINKDKADNVDSLPVLIGINNSKIVGITLMLFYLAIAFFIEIKSLFLIRGIVFFASVLVIFFSEPNRHRYFFIYLADGLLIFQTATLFVFLR